VRQVTRSATPVPLVDTVVATQRLAQTGNVDEKLCRHPLVVDALRAMYLDKCFLCEAADRNAQVEHFLPWHQTRPARAYDWKNLHWSCPACNQRKRRKPYRIPAQGCPERTDLIDPSAPPGGLRLGDLLTFDASGRAKALAAALSPQDRRVVDNTSLFLNDSEPHALRLHRIIAMCAVAADQGFVPLWRKIREMAEIQPDCWTGPDRPERLEALDRADALYGQFLAETQPFSTCMRVVAYEHLRLTADDFRRMSDAIRDFRKQQRLPISAT
jgi:uncharacterized protein (TIGR02646 family)